jgi:hypothetical protein
MEIIAGTVMISAITASVVGGVSTYVVTFFMPDAV